MDQLEFDPSWDNWGEPVAEELKEKQIFDNFGETTEEQEVTLKPLEIGKDVKERIASIMTKNQKYLREVADFNAKPKQCFTAEKYPEGFKLATY